MTHINDLPPELLTKILTHVYDASKQFSFRPMMQVCHRWSHIAAKTGTLELVSSIGEVDESYQPTTDFGRIEAQTLAIWREEVRKARLGAQEDPADKKKSRVQRQKTGVVDEAEVDMRLRITWEECPGIFSYS